MFGGMKGMGDLMKLAGQIPKIKENLAQAHERARNRVVTGEAGAGMVRVDASGTGEIIAVKIDPEALKDPDTVGPLIVAAANVALKKGKEILAEEARGAMGGIELPPGIL